MRYQEAQMHLRKEAEKQQCTMYLHWDWRGWVISATRWDDWLYAAHPDGAREFSDDGRKFEDAWVEGEG